MTNKIIVLPNPAKICPGIAFVIGARIINFCMSYQNNDTVKRQFIIFTRGHEKMTMDMGK
jgi:hypothetical protein